MEEKETIATFKLTKGQEFPIPDDLMEVFLEPWTAVEVHYGTEGEYETIVYKGTKK